MRASNAFLAVIVLIATLLLIIYGIAALSPLQYAQTNANTAAEEYTPLDKPTVTFGNPTLGPKEAKLTIVEFGDFLCQPCAELELTLQEVLSEYPKDVRFVWKDFPNPSLHSEAVNAAIAARCAAVQGAFWEYHDLLFAQQTSISKSNYLPFAAQLRLDLDAFQSCIDQQQTKGLIDRDQVEGLRLRVDSTPYLFIGDRRISGAIDAEQLRGFIDVALASLKQAEQPAPPVNAPTAAPGTDR